ncbi:hypothetical protein [Pleurocapsa sp. FMAR1]|uniref:hypothetical protein n=1 Tax=Pleurocapsa sp. FMAR1 TaxID=3040204 RepID=UPI0029C8C05B|nr:hypothetical protein [Pleurocapsa sp. FMAR1]
MPSLVTERIESVKAGILGAIAFTVAELVIVLIKTLIIDLLIEQETTAVLNWQLPIQLAIGAISGFLFGVTYRYIIRDDRNFHLNDGAVLAFGLVRGLALVEVNFVLSELLSLLFLVFQSIICFAIARSILDLAIARKLLKPFV